MSESWHEIRLSGDADLNAVYGRLDELGVLSAHHFRWEPWHPDGIVVRVLSDGVSLEDLLSLGGAVSSWDAAPDEELYGSAWPLVFRFFEASSRLAARIEHDEQVPATRRWLLGKIAHCHLNAWGLDVIPEARWALRFARDRVRVWWKYGRPWKP